MTERHINPVSGRPFSPDAEQIIRAIGAADKYRVVQVDDQEHEGDMGTTNPPHMHPEMRKDGTVYMAPDEWTNAAAVSRYRYAMGEEWCRANDWSRWLAQAWARIDSEVEGETATSGAGPPAQSERDSMDATHRDSPGHGDQVAR